MADEEERQNLENAAADNGQTEVNPGVHCADDVGTEPTKTESDENLVDSLNLESVSVFCTLITKALSFVHLMRHSV